MPLTPSEHAVMSRRDAGMSIGAIADELGRSRKSVRAVAYLYNDGPGDERRHRRAMERGSRELLQRIKKARSIHA